MECCLLFRTLTTHVAIQGSADTTHDSTPWRVSGSSVSSNDPYSDNSERLTRADPQLQLSMKTSSQAQDASNGRTPASDAHGMVASQRTPSPRGLLVTWTATDI